MTHMCERVAEEHVQAQHVTLTQHPLLEHHLDTKKEMWRSQCVQRLWRKKVHIELSSVWIFSLFTQVNIFAQIHLQEISVRTKTTSYFQRKNK